MMRRSRMVAAAVIAAVAVLVGAGTVWLLRGDEGPQATAKRYLAAWSDDDFAAMRALTDHPPADFATRFARMRDGLGVTRQRYRAAAGRSYTAELTLSGGHVWTYTGSLPFKKQHGKWRVVWSPQVMYPALEEGQRLRTERTWPARAGIQAADGSNLNGSPSGSVQQLVGPLGPASAAAAKKLGAPYRAGDTIGIDGLQRQYERRLAGTPALAVQIVGANGKPVRTLQRFGGTGGTPLRTTLDLKVERAAAAALGDVKKPASLVALRPSTGEILAVANKPGGYNRALMGQYPPGSTFKVVTAAALVAGGMDARSKVGCPATTTVDGRSFHNFQHENFGTIALREAFAHSCNTTFARLAVQRLGETRLAQVAAQFGFNVPIVAGLPAVRATFPDNSDDASLAAAAFGQGQVLTSPLNMASVAAAAADGVWRSPRLLDASLVSQAVDAGGRRPEPPHQLQPAVERALHSLMPAVVSEGTAAGVAFPPGTAGKTGTAEFGTGTNPPTHAWFIGYRGDLAFAVIVEGGGTGAEAAAPIAANFLRAAG
jgi:cell division protein FtsI/penicillin-binding protein 2